MKDNNVTSFNIIATIKKEQCRHTTQKNSIVFCPQYAQSDPIMTLII